ncbi:MAG: cobalamin-binding protein [Pseudomonadota bacterium]
MKTGLTRRKMALFFIALFFFYHAAEIEAKEVLDQLGRRIIVPDRPRRVIAMAPSVTEIIFAVGAEDRLKGVTQYSNYPSPAAKLPRVGSYIQLDIEKIVALNPDLCIAVKDGNPREVIERLERLNIPSYAVDPRNLESLMTTILEIADLMNVSGKGKLLVQGLRNRIEKVRSGLSGTTDRPSVFFQIGISPIVSAGTDTFIHELILLAGGKNLAQGPAPYPRFSTEQVLSLSPEVFIITSMTRGESFERIKAEWSRWSRMPAVKNNRIHLVDSDIVDRASPRLVDGLELLAGLIHPERFR